MSRQFTADYVGICNLFWAGSFTRSTGTAGICLAYFFTRTYNNERNIQNRKQLKCCVELNSLFICNSPSPW